MSVLHNMKLFYLKKIKRQDNSTILINHLRKIGMHIGTGCCIFSEKIETAEPYLVTIGNRVMISDNVSFTTQDASAIYYLPGASDIFGRIYYGDDCFIGMGTIILPGVTIPHHCIIGAGSVVTKSFSEPYSVIAGNPAKYLCSVEELKNKNQKYTLNTHGKNFEEKRTYLLQNEGYFKGAHH